MYAHTVQLGRLTYLHLNTRAFPYSLIRSLPKRTLSILVLKTMQWPYQWTPPSSWRHASFEKVRGHCIVFRTMYRKGTIRQINLLAFEY